MAANVFFNALQAIDANGDAVSGAKVRFFDTGTTNLQTVYTDSGLGTAHPDPLVADSSGVFAAVFQSGSTALKVTMTDASDVALPGYPIDPAVSQDTAGAASTVPFSPTFRIIATDVQAAIEEVDGDVKAIEDARVIEKSVYDTSGTATTYTIAVTGFTAYSTGGMLWVRADATNTGAATINVESVGAKNIKKYDGSGSIQSLAAGDFVIGSEYLLHYDGTQFVIICERLGAATTTTKGVAKLATQAEAEAGTDDLAMMTALKTKQAIDALSPISANSYASSAQTITAAGSLTLAHGLGSTPKLFAVYLKCLTADDGYSVGDEVLVNVEGTSNQGASSNKGISIVPDATNINIRFGSSASVFQILNKGTGVATTGFVPANWNLYVRAWL